MARWRLKHNAGGRTRRPSKYHAEAVQADDIHFPSKLEARRYQELKLMESAGDISGLELQPKFPFGTDENPVLIRSNGYPNGRRAYYRADFKYFDEIKREWVVEDTKGYDLPIGRLKRALVEWQYGIKIRVL